MQFSVLIPAHNEAGQLGVVLDHLATQEIDPSHEGQLVVVPNGCTDTTQEVVEAWANGDTGIFVDTKIIPLEKGNKKLALNAGIAACTGEVILSTDADIIQGEGVVDRILTEFENNSDIMLQGTLTMPNTQLYPQDTALKDVQILRALRRAVLPVRRSASGAMMAFRQEAEIAFPEGQCIDDSWLWAHTIDTYGIDAVRTHMDRHSYYKPVQNWDELLKQEARYSLAFPMVAEQFPHLAYVDRYVRDWIDNYTDPEKLEQDWRTSCAGAGVRHFEAIRSLSELVTAKAKTLVPDIKASIQANAGRFEVLTTTKGM